MSQPGTRPESEALVPETNSVQSAALSSSQRPAALRFTIWPTLGAVITGGMLVLSGGSKVRSSLGGGFIPPYGPSADSTAPGTGSRRNVLICGARIVVALPDSKMAT